MPLTCTVAPCAASARAMPAPTFCPAPVTTATLPLRSNMRGRYPARATYGASEGERSAPEDGDEAHHLAGVAAEVVGEREAAVAAGLGRLDLSLGRCLT